MDTAARAKAVPTRLGRPASVALLVALVWGLGLVVVGFLAPMYRSTSESTPGQVTHGTDTLVGANGLGVVAVLAAPLAATVLVGCALLLRNHRGALPAAWTLTGLLALFNLLAMMSIGVLVIPVTVCLVIACAMSREPPGQLGPVSDSSVAQ